MRDLQKRYQKGRIPFTACRQDPRFSYCLYVPECHQNYPEQTAPLLVVVHGSARTAESFRDAFVEFAERERCVVLAPLFPVGAVVSDSSDGYKLQPPRGYAYDHLLLAMVDEVAQAFHTERDFLLYGFSGGAQFAHRFYYLHPQRIKGLSAHAPGQVCLPPQSEGALHAMRQVPVQLVIGSEDRGTERSGLEMGLGRAQLLQMLADALGALGVNVCRQEVEGAGHDGFALLPAGQAFLADQLRNGRC